MTAFIIPETAEGQLQQEKVSDLLQRLDPQVDSVVTDAGNVIHQPIASDDSNSTLESI